MSNPFVGTRGAVQVNRQTLALAKWSVDPECDMVPYRNFASVVGGVAYDANYPGFVHCDIEISGDVDEAGLIWNALINLVPGQIIGPINCYLDFTNSRGWTFPVAIVVGTPTQDEAEGKATVSVKLKSQGPFTFPS